MSVIVNTSTPKVIINSGMSTGVSAMQAAQAWAEDAEISAAEAAASAAEAANSASILTGSDLTARVSAILSSRALTTVQAIAFFSNAGAGRKVQASYVTEARPAGRFLGDYASATAAWAANYGGIASVAGDYYWNTASTELAELTTLNNSTAVRRGSQNYLPAEGVAVACVTSGIERLLIFDLTHPLVPLWMEFRGTTSYLWNFSTSAGSFTTVEMKWDGLKLWAGRDGGTGQCLMYIDFALDEAVFWSNTGKFRFNGTIEFRNSGLGPKLIDSTITVDNNITSLAVSNGYAAFTTDVGLAVITPKGELLKAASTTAFAAIEIFKNRLYALRTNLNPDVLYDYGDLDRLTASFSTVYTYRNSSLPYLSNHTVRTPHTVGDSMIVRYPGGVDRLWLDSGDPTNGMISRKSTKLATPPMKKPEIMLICSTETGSITDAADYVSDFSTTVDGFTSVNNTYVTWDPTGKLIVDRNAALGGATGHARSRSGILQVGRVYLVTFVVSSSPGSMRIAIAGAAVLEESDDAYYPGSGTHTYLIRATNTYFDIYLTNTYGEVKFSSITAEEVIQNCSGTALAKTKADINWHGAINGSLTATALTTDAVAMVSGFTTNTNYISAPNPWAGVGSSDAWLCGVFKCTASTVDERILSIGYWDGAASLNAAVAVGISASGSATIYVSNDGTATSVQALTSGTYDDSEVHTFFVKKTSTHYILEIDGLPAASIAVGSHGNLTFHASATAFIGRTASGTTVGAALSVALIGGGLGSISQKESTLVHTYLRNLVSKKANLVEDPYRVAYNPAKNSAELVGAGYLQTIVDGVVTATAISVVGSTPFIGCGAHGEIGYGGTTGLVVSVPEKNLREDPAIYKKVEKTFRYVPDGSRVNFPSLTSDSERQEFEGYTISAVLKNGIELDTDDYALYTAPPALQYAKFTTAPLAADIIKIRGFKYEQS